MTEVLPEPLVPADCDCRDLDGFMLNVERLMASELVALASHEVIGAALLIWCRAWKQVPAASLPDDDRILSAFARMPVQRFKRYRPDIMRGFVKCSDGRLYHRVLSSEAVVAFGRKTAFRAKRETDAKRLRDWRMKQHGNDDETRFVPEGQGRDVTLRDRTSNRDVEVTPTGVADLSTAEQPKGNGAIGKIATAKAETGADWSDPAWVNATADTLGLRPRTNESPTEFRDRVYAAVEERKREARAEGERRQREATA